MNILFFILLGVIVYLVAGIWIIGVHNNIATWRRIRYIDSEGDAVLAGIFFWWKVLWDLWRNQKKSQPVEIIRRQARI
ncbi:hypothetical protein FJ208_01895 [Candidatus Gribaldobacteria bacterium]|nr:hypothetical protein [Candidatus Gribaldobacteria bacterium]